MGGYFFYNGNILTMDGDSKTAESVLVGNGKIIFCGDYKEGIKYTDDKTKHINLNGRTLLPGFNDSHMHLISYGLSKYKVDLSNADSIDNIKAKLHSFVKDEKSPVFKEWILGSGWNHERFKEKRLPTKEDIDEIIKDRPVFLSRACYHICVVNSKALEVAGIDKNTKDPEGGKIDRDPITGEPTGVLRENALYMVYNKIPFIEDIDDIKEIVQSGIEEANKVGITSIQTDDFSHLKSYTKIIDAYKQLRDENKLNARINLQMLLKDKKTLEDFLTLKIKTGDGDEWVRFGPLKILGDGSLGSRTAALDAPYEDDKNTNGVLIYGDQEVGEILELAYKKGLQLAVHAIGDRCMNQILNIYKKLYEKYPKKDPRFRIIHCQICSQEILAKFKELDVIADIQPIFMKTDMYMAENRVGKERMKWSYQWKKMKEMGIRLAGGSDCPVETFNPILGVYTAVTRKDLKGYPEEGWYPEEKLDLYDALKLFTTNSAYCTFEEKVKGKIKKGMLADLVILSEDITSVEPDTIKDVQVDMTMVGGKIVYQR